MVEVVAQSGPVTVGDWSTQVAAFFASYAPALGLALLAVAGVTVTLAIGWNLVGRVWAALASIGDERVIADAYRSWDCYVKETDWIDSLSDEEVWADWEDFDGWSDNEVRALAARRARLAVEQWHMAGLIGDGDEGPADA